MPTLHLSTAADPSFLQGIVRMFRDGIRHAVWMVALLSLCGCAVNRETADITQGVDLSNVRSFYVVKLDADERGVDALIAKQLVAMGFRATVGAESAKPGNVDAIVTYRDKWFWDITMYMLELDITLRNPTSNFPMAVGNSFHTSLTRKAPEEMVKEVLTNIFNKSKKGSS